jgi:exodeoxyribonuclease V
VYFYLGIYSGTKVILYGFNPSIIRYYLPIMGSLSLGKCHDYYDVPNFKAIMLKDHIKNLLIEALGHEPTADQLELLEKLTGFVMPGGGGEVFLIKGYAGTGKTTCVSALVKMLASMKIPSILLAPTGRAAKVISGYSGHPAYTIHKRIYKPRGVKEGIGEFVLDKNMAKDAFFIVDEASMLSNYSSEGNVFGSGNLMDDLFRYVFSGLRCKLILVGDTAQLPPVRFHLSPALDRGVIEGYGREVIEVSLMRVVRQTLDSGILLNATQVRSTLGSAVGTYPSIEVDNQADMQLVSGNELIEELSTAYDKYGLENTMVVCRSNQRANRYNQGIRNQILYRESELEAGDYLMIVKNNYFWTAENEKIDFIANGDIARVNRVRKYHERYGYRYAEVSLCLVDYDEIDIEVNVMLDTLHLDAPAISSEDSKQLFLKVMEDYPDVKSKSKRIKMVKEDPFFNALQVKYAYAVTCHKAQGGQWKAVFVDQGYITDEKMDTEYLRWLYTAITRASEKLYLVNFSPRFFENNKQG